MTSQGFTTYQSFYFNILHQIDLFKTEDVLETVRSALARKYRDCTLDYRISHPLLKHADKLEDGDVQIRGAFSPQTSKTTLPFLVSGRTEHHYDGDEMRFERLFWPPVRGASRAQDAYRKPLVASAETVIKQYFSTRGEDQLEKRLAKLSSFSFPAPLSLGEVEQLLCTIHAKLPEKTTKFAKAGMSYGITQYKSLRRESDCARVLPKGIAIHGDFTHPLLPGSLSFSVAANAEGFSTFSFGSPHESIFSRFDDYRKKEVAVAVHDVLRHYFFARQLREKHPLLWQGSPDKAPAYATANNK